MQKCRQCRNAGNAEMQAMQKCRNAVMQAMQKCRNADNAEMQAMQGILAYYVSHDQYQAFYQVI